VAEKNFRHAWKSKMWIPTIDTAIRTHMQQQWKYTWNIHKLSSESWVRDILNSRSLQLSAANYCPSQQPWWQHQTHQSQTLIIQHWMSMLFFLAKQVAVDKNQNYGFKPILSLLSCLKEKEHCCSSFILLCPWWTKICAKLCAFRHLCIKRPLHILATESPDNVTTDRILYDLHMCMEHQDYQCPAKNVQIPDNYQHNGSNIINISSSPQRCFWFLLHTSCSIIENFHPKHKKLANIWKFVTYTIRSIFKVDDTVQYTYWRACFFPFL
jgi:hypothetical protein